MSTEQKDDQQSRSMVSRREWFAAMASERDVDYALVGAPTTVLHSETERRVWARYQHAAAMLAEGTRRASQQP